MGKRAKYFDMDSNKHLSDPRMQHQTWQHKGKCTGPYLSDMTVASRGREWFGP